MSPSLPPVLLIANPSADVYGSDLQMLETARAMVARGWRVIVLTPDDGPLVPRLRDAGADVRFEQYPVLRRALAAPRGVAGLALSAPSLVWHLRGRIRAFAPCVVYVNTVTLPWWLLAARVARVPVVCHVHEAEVADARGVRLALTAPLMLASSVIANGEPARRAALDVVSRLDGKVRVIENGVAGPPTPVGTAPAAGPTRLVVVGRLSPRKATHVALEAVARLRASGRDVVLELCGTAFAGYEWYVTELEERASQPDLAGAVTFSGYVVDLWSTLERSHIAVAPSLGESLGNAVIQAQLAARPVVASEVQGHTESVIDGETGLLVPAGDPDALAAAVGRVIDDPGQAADLAARGRELASRRFAPERYDAAMASELEAWCDLSPSAAGAY